jgi:hypothetical protein
MQTLGEARTFIAGTATPFLPTNPRLMDSAVSVLLQTAGLPVPLPLQVSHRAQLNQTGKGLRESLAQAGRGITIPKLPHLARLANHHWEDSLSREMYNKMDPIRKIARLGVVE